MLEKIYYKIKQSNLYIKFSVTFATLYLLSGMAKSSLIAAFVTAICIQLLPWSYFE